jgi:hypothetical protein
LKPSIKGIAWNARATIERVCSAVRWRVGLDAELYGVSASWDILHPGEGIAGPLCIALPGQYDRVRCGPFGIDIGKEIAELQGSPRTVGPTIRYELENVLVVEGLIYGQGRRKRFNSELDCQQVPLSWEQYEEVAVRSSYVGCHFFGHWLRDDCATHLLAEQVSMPMSMPTPSWPDRAGYLSLFGQTYSEFRRAHVRRLVLFEDIAQNDHKAQRFRVLRRRLTENRVPGAAGRIVYLMRGASGKQRSLLNESEVVEALMLQGVKIVQAEALSVPDLIAQLLGARIVVSIEGSQLSHALFTLCDEGGILAIQPPDRFFNSHMDWARALNMRYGVVVGEERPSGFHLPVDDLLRTIELMDAAVA